MRNIKRLLLACNLVLPACVPVQSDEARTAVSWRFPRALQGPLNSPLPHRAAVDTVVTCAGASRTVAVVWTLGTDNDAIVREIERRGAEEKPPYPDLRSWEYVAPPGQFVEACVVSGGRAGRSHFLAGVGADLYRGDWLLGRLAYSGEGRCVLGLALHGVSAVQVGESGFGAPTVVDGEAKPTLLGKVVWPFTDNGRTNVFWFERYLPRFAFPDSGLERLRLRRSLVTPGTPPTTSTPYTFDFHLGEGYLDAVIVDRGGGRYDLVYESYRGRSEPLTSNLYYVPHVLSSGWKVPKVIGDLQGGAKTAALELPGDRLEVLWMDIVEKEFATSTGPWLRRTGRLHETHISAHGWSKQRCLFQGEGWNPQSLACAVFRLNGTAGVVAIWTNRDRRLTYAMTSDLEAWSGPYMVDLAIGDTNWLVPMEGGMFLVTRMNGNLYWCYLDAVAE